MTTKKIEEHNIERTFIMKICYRAGFKPRWDYCPICNKYAYLVRHHWYNEDKSVAYVVLICQSCNVRLKGFSPEYLINKQAELMLSGQIASFGEIKTILDQSRNIKSGRSFAYESFLLPNARCMICNYEWRKRNSAIVESFRECPWCGSKEIKYI